MFNNIKTLIEFEKVRKDNSYIPPEKSNSVYQIGEGEITLYTQFNNIENIEMDLSIFSKSVKIGNGLFAVDDPYRTLSIAEDATLIVDGILCIKNDSDLYGTIHIKENGILIITNKSSFYCRPNSKLIIDRGAQIITENHGAINTDACMIDVDVNVYPNIINNKNIYIDPAAVVTITGIDLGKRSYSLTDYEYDLRSKIINIHTQGEYNSTTGRVSYKWTGGSPLNKSQVIDLSLTWGEMPLGDFKLSVLGIPLYEIENKQRISNINIGYGSILYISDDYQGYTYLNPELYLSSSLNWNSDTNLWQECNPGKCTVNGTIVVSGNNSFITIDRSAVLHITETGIIKLINNGSIRCNAQKEITNLIIDGTIIMDDISQLISFHDYNIQFGEKGKIIILNPDRNDNRILFSTPIGIHESELYRLFENTIDHIEYHVSKNTGISIDRYYDYFNRDMTDWFGNRRIEKAIHDGILVWEDGGFIELNSNIIPWVNNDCTLLEASRLFKSYGSSDKEKLEEVAARLKYAGSGSISFHFVNGETIKIVTLTMDESVANSVVANTMTNNYTIDSTNDGELFLRNGIASTSTEEIVNDESKVIHVNKGETNFILE